MKPILVLCLLLLAPAAFSKEVLGSLAGYRAAAVRAMLEESPEGAVGRYDDKVRLIPPYHATVFGKRDARAWHAAFFERFDVRSYRRDPVETFDLGSRLIETGTFTLILTRSGDTRTHEISGGYMDIWAQVSGQPTHLLTHAWNTDRYPEIANDLRFANVPGTKTALEAHVPIRDDLSFELAALNKLHEAAVSQGDQGVWALFFAPDALLFANHHGLVRGRPAIDQYLARHVVDMPVFEKLDIRNDEIDVAGKFVIEYASHVANWRNGDASGVNTGKNIRVWRREPGGFLKMICGIGTYD